VHALYVGVINAVIIYRTTIIFAFCKLIELIVRCAHGTKIDLVLKPVCIEPRTSALNMSLPEAAARALADID